MSQTDPTLQICFWPTWTLWSQKKKKRKKNRTKTPGELSKLL